jgi:hypothetical protein
VSKLTLPPLLFVLLTAPAFAQTNKEVQQALKQLEELKNKAKKADDKPADKGADALVTGLVRDLKSKRAADRAKTADGLGPLAEKAGLASRALCEALLDTSPQVRLAAEHALEKVIPAFHRLVVPIVVDKDLRERVPAIQRVGHSDVTARVSGRCIAMKSKSHVGFRL